MLLNINTQLLYFFSNVIAGFMVGVMFDIYRVIRGFKNPNRILTAISDILFWILASLITFIFMLVTNNVNIRYYTFIALFIGLYFYFSLISRMFLDILRYFVYYFIKLIRLLIRLILFPFKLIRILIIYTIYLFERFEFNLKNKLNKMQKDKQENTI
ncbi:Spore protein YabQ [Caloramator mitchellensis]|uniref:Spore protein YabQ n=1 Tax=Caloramator mitchellensis TaxID=908809 RepID=A0A0R3JT29_CALMK|nr:spore cortex biosynthesis protein YabQ [Caloramator mitchellensis]KRQ86679.1 Spore protein YabQ [Caloramator mitchellensis]